jgi:hypothetical protein
MIPPAGTDYDAVDADRHAACASHNDGSIECWGHSATNLFRAQPEASGLESVTLADRTGCALDDQGWVGCWGDTFFDLLW